MKKRICLIGTGIGIGSFLDNIDASNYEEIIIVDAGSVKSTENTVRKEIVGRPFGLRSTVSIEVGGTSNLWHGVLSPMSHDDFEEKEFIKYSGWPITYDELEPYYKKAATILGVDNYSNFSLDALDSDTGEFLKDIQFNRSFLENKIFQQPMPPKNFKNQVLDFCTKNNNVTLLKEHVALEFKIRSGIVSHLVVGVNNGETHSISADVFIVGAGALETPRLLLNSNISNYNIGRFLMDHPMGNLCQLKFKKPQKAPLYSDLKLSSSQKIKSGLVMKKNIRKKLKLLNHNFYLRPSFVEGINDETERLKLSLLSFRDGKLTFFNLLKVLKNINVVKQILVYKLSLNVTYKFADLFFVAEQRPNPNSTVSLSEKKDRWGYPIAKVNWQVLPEDISDMKRWYLLTMSEFFPKERYKFTHKPEDFKWEDVYTSAIHHVGTARMSSSQETGVVDNNLKVFGVENLYVCDGSVFTTSGNVNSSFTISALACKLFDHINNKYKL